MSEHRDLLRKYLQQREDLGEGPVVMEQGQGNREQMGSGVEEREVEFLLEFVVPCGRQRCG